MEQVYQGITFDRAFFSFVQDGNTLGTTEEAEVLQISLETQLPGDTPFVVIKSETGWSVDDMSELTKIVDKCLGYYKDMITIAGEKND